MCWIRHNIYYDFVFMPLPNRKRLKNHFVRQTLMLCKWCFKKVWNHHVKIITVLYPMTFYVTMIPHVFMKSFLWHDALKIWCTIPLRQFMKRLYICYDGPDGTAGILDFPFFGLIQCFLLLGILGAAQLVVLIKHPMVNVHQHACYEQNWLCRHHLIATDLLCLNYFQ